MFPKTPREGWTLMFWLTLVFLLEVKIGDLQVPPFMVGLSGLLFLASILGLLSYVVFPGPPAPVDIWESQQALMKASAQQMPTHPRLTNESILYAALTMEELGESILVMRRAMDRWYQAPCESFAGQDKYDQLLLTLTSAENVLAQMAVSLRVDLQTLAEPVAVPLSLTEAAELLDGITDTTVTIAGFSLASGLPGREGYTEVQTSNLSKRNPVTDIIDKHPDGKWIKGWAYRAPDMIKVIQMYTPGCYEEQDQPDHK